MNDINKDVTQALSSELEYRNERVILRNIPFEDIVAYYQGKTFTSEIVIEFGDINDFMYLDPPYPEISRRSGKKYYKYEMLTIEEHTNFLNLCRMINANIMISTRQNYLYDLLLSDWRKKEFETVDRQGKVIEVIYMNYPEPDYLHQYDHLGIDFIDRQRIKRKVTRFANKIDRLPQYEKMAILQEVFKQNSDQLQQLLSMR